MWNFIINFVINSLLVLNLSIENVESMCTTAYGGEPCAFVPAPPGHIPPCARPGETFCEKVEHYPMQHIRYLIEKWGYDYSSLFNDETRDEYSTYFAQPDYHGYSNTYGAGYTYPEPIHIPKPPPGSAPYPHPNNKYVPPSVPGKANYTNGFAGYPDRRQPIKYPGYNLAPPGNHIANHNGHRTHAHHGNFVPSVGPAGYYPSTGGFSNQGNTYYDPNQWWRYGRDNKNLVSRTKRSPTKKQFIKNVDTIKNSTNSSRSKRQAALGGAQQLCPTRAQFIMPRAALNNKGNWMYVVNLQEQDNRYTQLVRSETCVSQQCNGICAVPTGYTARCEQRYVQKRLVALEGAGQNLYTDVFWFPSCCVCTFANN